MRGIGLVAVMLLAASCSGGDPSLLHAQGGVVRLRIVPALPASGTVPAHVLVNDTKQTIGYGYPFALRRWDGDEWTRVPETDGCIFPLPGLHLEPGERSDAGSVVHCADEGWGLPRGLYRVMKDITLDDETRHELATTFTVW